MRRGDACADDCPYGHSATSADRYAIADGHPHRHRDPIPDADPQSYALPHADSDRDPDPQPDTRSAYRHPGTH
jgi:hypothetical protein